MREKGNPRERERHVKLVGEGIGVENFQLVSIRSSFYCRVQSSKLKYKNLDEDKYNWCLNWWILSYDSLRDLRKMQIECSFGQLG